MSFSLGEPETVLILRLAHLATATPKRLRRMRRFLEARQRVMMLGASPKAIQDALDMLTLLEGAAKEEESRSQVFERLMKR